MSLVPRSYPRGIECGDSQVAITRMTGADRDALVAFIATLPPHDLLFVPRDIGHPRVIDAWLGAIDAGDVSSLAVRDGGTLVGCTAIVADALSWSKHVGELRVLVSPTWRGKGLGRVLIQECFAQALTLGLKKLVAQMTTDQRAAVAVFEEMGFRPEALLSKHVADRSGKLHDLVLLSHNVDAVAARNELLGLREALGA
jgi:L-amino acid N-acyltransferase YncA